MPIETIAHDDDALIRATAHAGEAEITVCTDGTCRFDGGAMFGVVPKTLWSRRMEADADNRVMLGLNCMLIRHGGKRILIETGFGSKIAPRLKQIYATEERLPASLAAAGVTPGQIDIVVNTHLHWDHCGWNTVLAADGTALPFFPNAQYFAHRGEVEHGRRQHERDRISYVPENYEPLLRSGQMRLIERPEEEIMTGLWTECFPGHTRQLMTVHLESGTEHACFVSDLVPTSAHLDPTWVMGFDLDPLRTIEERLRFYARCLTENWMVFFPHDHRVPAAVLEQDSKKRMCILPGSGASVV